MYILCLGFRNFPKTWKPFQKPTCQKSEIQEVHNLNFRHCLVFSAQKFENIGSMAVTSPTGECDWNQLEHLKGTVCMFFGVCTHRNTDCYYGKNEHDTLNVSKPVVRYLKYVHVKACLAGRYILTAWGQVKMTLIPAPGKVEGYHPISLLYFMQKTIENW